jgi:hypothetical protein
MLYWIKAQGHKANKVWEGPYFRLVNPMSCSPLHTLCFRVALFIWASVWTVFPPTSDDYVSFSFSSTKEIGSLNNSRNKITVTAFKKCDLVSVEKDLIFVFWRVLKLNSLNLAAVGPQCCFKWLFNT